MYPLRDDFSLFAKLGVAVSSTKSEYTGKSLTKTGILNYGAGIIYDLAAQWALRVEFEIFNRVGDNVAVPQATVDFWSIGAVYKF
jgi:opacity protein-like surface antigen